MIYSKRTRVLGSVFTMSLRWQHPSKTLISGPSSAGKTVFVKNFLKYIDELSDTVFDRIMFYYSEWQPAYKELGDNIEFHEGLPKSSDYNDDPRPKLMIIDDLMRESSTGTGGSVVADLFSKGSHHHSLSIMFITQNLFHRGQREISLNSNYIVVFKNPRDMSQIQFLARQVCPENPLYVKEAYLDATRHAHSYLLFDLCQKTPDNCRLRACIFPFDPHHYVYVPRKHFKTANSGNELPVVRL